MTVVLRNTMSRRSTTLECGGLTPLSFFAREKPPRDYIGFIRLRVEAKERKRYRATALQGSSPPRFG